MTKTSIIKIFFGGNDMPKITKPVKTRPEPLFELAKLPLMLKEKK
jgi:hypothetical protein